MPINIPDALPAKEILQNENIFIMDEASAYRQDIRPLKILILNLMPEKEKTETQLLRLLGNSPLQAYINFLRPITHVSKNTGIEHLNTFYKTFDEIKDSKYDGMIITGAPVEQFDFEKVTYWEELKTIMEWSKKNVTSTLHICWGAQAGLFYHFGIQKYSLPQKLSGIFLHQTLINNKVTRGFDEQFYAPHSRYTETRKEDVEKIPELELLASSKAAGVYLAATKDGKHIFLTGHPEYDCYTLKDEYNRDLSKGINPPLPKNYFPNNDPNQNPIHQWKSHANLLIINWLNYYVYQETPYIWE